MADKHGALGVRQALVVAVSLVLYRLDAIRHILERWRDNKCMMVKTL